eukprot:TRINITY_DN81152_c0_g1_i1.p1 TRINITY_DN81152_c0_g1~~TRINITY_DN81152_c0_g1_i1.p1  ORF type:complete len:191 (-),score=35.19 TRINITY_DN81152_c0_g1_i1:217-789(-)
MKVKALKEELITNWTGPEPAFEVEEQLLLLKDQRLDDERPISMYGMHKLDEVALTLVRKRPDVTASAGEGGSDMYGGYRWDFKVQPADPSVEKRLQLEAGTATIFGAELLEILQSLPSQYGIMNVKKKLEKDGADVKWLELEKLIQPEEHYPVQRTQTPNDRIMEKTKFKIEVLCSMHHIFAEGWSHNWK